LTDTVKRLATSAGIECPSLCLVDSGTPSAFTVRTRRKYTIALSIGLLESFDRTEVEACLAHEIGHIKNRDFALRTFVTMARMALFARVLSYFVEAAFYRARELLADRTAALLMGGPGPLISALEKLQNDNYADERLTGSAICFFEPKQSIFRLLNKHPSLTTRIRLLKEMYSLER
jgi:heat shock protein HtpX